MHCLSFRSVCRLAILGLWVTSGHLMELSAQDEVDFVQDVRPILSNVCFHCHGPDENTRQGDLRLDTFEGLFNQRDGYHIVKPADVQSSELLQRVLSDDADLVMPPADSSKQLTKEQKDVLRRWVEQGAEWKQHWSFIKPETPAVPSVPNDDWCRNEIDYFILARQRAAGLAPSPQASALTLIRRLYLDLTGLPPTPEQADHWAQRIWGQSVDVEGSPCDEQAYLALVNELLDSPHYGERWGRRWLDLARYADTNGYEKDRDRSIWPYRDWVVNAINSDMPFDQFTIEQIAGDMVGDSTVDQQVATGFHRNTMLNEEGGIDPLEFRFHAMTDRVATTGTTWLGLTLGCCQCHTHKYDPISHTEYYQLMAFLNNADEPSLELPDEAIDARWRDNLQRAARLTDELADKWPVQSTTDVPARVIEASADGDQSVVVQDDGLILVSAANPDKAQYTVQIQVQDPTFTHLSLQATTPEGASGPGRTDHGNFVLSEIDIKARSAASAPDTPNAENYAQIGIRSATASVQQNGFEIPKAFDGQPNTGWAIHGPKGVPRDATAVFELDPNSLKPIPNGPLVLQITLKQAHGTQHTLAAFRLSTSRQRSDADADSERHQIVQQEFQKWLDQERKNAVPWQNLKPVTATSNLPILTIQDDDSIFASGDTAKRDDYFIELAASSEPIHAIRLEALPDDRLPARGPGSTYYEGTLGDFFLNEIRFTSQDQDFPIQSATESYAKNRFGSNPATAALAFDSDVQTGWSVHGRQGERHVAVFVLQEPVPAGVPVKVQMTFGRHFASSLGRFRFAATSQSTAPQARGYSEQIGQLLLQDEQASDQQSAALFREFLLSAAPLAQHAEKIHQLKQRPAATSTLVLRERPHEHPRPTFRHHRGEYLQPREPVEAATPGVLHDFPESYPRNRLGFARWIVSADNPLTARVVVNRQWAAFFGSGLVKTLDDFGLQGDAPSHPQLLDWMATTWVTEDHWSLKSLHRRIVTSSTYRQSSTVNPAAKSVDPGNRLLCYAPRFRMDAELVRDQFLVASGAISRTIGGPPVRPLQPAGVTESAYGSPQWSASAGADRYRRSLYTFAKRTAPFAMLSTFDGPSGEACIARRNRSNSPLQALTLLNDVMLVDLAGRAGLRMVDYAHDHSDLNIRQQVAYLMRLVLVRHPSEDEVAALTDFFTAQLAAFESNPAAAESLLGESRPKDPADVPLCAAWTATARVVFALDEALTRE
jgi:hypothetical protein